MTKRNDISVPAGYFENLQERLGEVPHKELKPTVFQKVSPWLAYAASLAIMVSLANFIFRQPAASATDEEYGWDYVSYLSRSLDPDGMVELRETEALSQEDIMNFLLASNVKVEQLMYENYEEDY